MNFPIRQREKLPPPVVDESIRGLGDIVATIAEPIKKYMMANGSKAIQEYLARCKCNERKAWLNKHFPL
jgi:hypothetical protein